VRLGLARHRAGIGAGLPLGIPLVRPLYGAHAERPLLELCALRLFVAEVVLALMPRVVVHVASLDLVGLGDALVLGGGRKRQQILGGS